MLRVNSTNGFMNSKNKTQTNMPKFSSLRSFISKFVSQICEKNYSQADKTLDTIITEKVKNRISKTKTKVEIKKSPKTNLKKNTKKNLKKDKKDSQKVTKKG